MKTNAHWVNAPELAKILKVSVSTVWAWKWHRGMPFMQLVRPNGKVFFDPEQVTAWIKSQGAE